jgi:hypothetical protein
LSSEKLPRGYKKWSRAKRHNSLLPAGETPQCSSPGTLSSPDLARSILECGSSSYHPYSFRARQEEHAGRAGRRIYGLATVKVKRDLYILRRHWQVIARDMA